MITGKKSKLKSQNRSPDPQDYSSGKKQQLAEFDVDEIADDDFF